MTAYFVDFFSHPEGAHSNLQISNGNTFRGALNTYDVSKFTSEASDLY